MSGSGSNAVAKRPSGSGGGNRTVSKRYSGASGGGGGGGIWRYYTDDAAGLKIGPTTVLVVSLLFVCFVMFLHIFGKFRR